MPWKERASTKGKAGGPSTTDEQLPTMQRLMRDEETTTREICQTFSISRATLYRYVSPEGRLKK